MTALLKTLLRLLGVRLEDGKKIKIPIFRIRF